MQQKKGMREREEKVMMREREKKEEEELLRNLELLVCTSLQLMMNFEL